MYKGAVRSLRWTLVCAVPCLVTLTELNAQYVTVPDTNMRVWLNTIAPGCIDVNGDLDTTHAGLLAVEDAHLMADWPAPIDLDGLQYLVGLQELTITGGNDTITNLPLPHSLKLLELGQVVWGVPPMLPDGLRKFIAESSQMSMLPSWPSQLEVIRLHQDFQISDIPPLPSSLTTLQIIRCHGLLSVPVIPAGVRLLTLAGGSLPQVTTFPSACDSLILMDLTWSFLPPLPVGIQYLDLHHLYYVSTVPQLPDGLRELKVTSISGLTLPGTMPDSCRRLTFRSNTWAAPLPLLPEGTEDLTFYLDGIQAIPALPVGLRNLSVSECDSLSVLPPLPDSLRTLALNFVPLAVVPPLPAHLERFSIGGAPVASLPPLPDGLVVFVVSSMPDLYSLPELPDSLRSLIIANSPVDCLPWLPDGMQELMLQGWSGVDCLPNVPANPTFTAMQGGAPFTTMCNALNSTCPWQNPVIGGVVYQDLDGDGTRDPGEPGWSGGAVSIVPGGSVVPTEADGTFRHTLPSGSYSVMVDGSVPYVLSVSPPQYAVSLSNTDVDTLLEFGLHMQPGLQDLRAAITVMPARPGFQNSVWLHAINVGTVPVAPIVSFTFDADQTFHLSLPAADQLNANTATWALPPIGPGGSAQVEVLLSTAPSVALGTVIDHQLQVGPQLPDNTPTDNSATSSSVVVGSYDPNDKLVEPNELTPMEVANGSRVTYTVRFQNTGSYYAESVWITDTLSPDLQWNTMQFIGSSHPHQWYIGHGVLHVFYPSIYLPASSDDEAGSHGFFEFTMKPSVDLLLGDEVENRAAIFFDFNEPIVTEPAVFVVSGSVGVPVAHGSDDLRLYPVPAQDRLTVVLKGEGKGHLELMDMNGRVLRQEVLADERVVIALDDLSAGVYYVRFGQRVARFVKQ